MKTYIPLADDPSLFSKVSSNQVSLERPAPYQVKFRCKDRILCQLISSAEIKINDDAPVQLSQNRFFRGRDIDTNIGGSFRPINIRRTLTYINNHVSDESLQSLTFSNGLNLLNPSDGVIIFENPSMSHHYFDDLDFSGHIDSRDQVIFKFNS